MEVTGQAWLVAITLSIVLFVIVSTYLYMHYRKSEKSIQVLGATEKVPL